MDPKTITAHTRAVRAYAEWHQFTTGEVLRPERLDGRILHRFANDRAPTGLRGWGTGRPAPATRNKAIARLRVFCQWTRETGVVREDLSGNLTTSWSVRRRKPRLRVVTSRTASCAF